MGGSGLDYSGIEKLYNQISDFSQQHQAFLHEFLLEMGQRCLKETKKLTPVGSYPESIAFYARKDLNDSGKGIGLVELWGVGGGSPGNLRRNWMLSGVFKQGTDLCIILYNPVEYAAYVEYGHRVKGFNSNQTVGWSEGRHMAQISIEKIQQEIPARYNAAFKQFLAGLGGR